MGVKSLSRLGGGTSARARRVYSARPVTTSTRWVRNPSWLPMPTIISTDEKVAILHAVLRDYAYVALSATGAYTVDWGDGIVENVATGVTASHIYDPNAVVFDGTDAPVTIANSGDVLTRVAHGHTDGSQVKLYDLVGGAGLVTGVGYYVVNATADTFQLSATLGGAAIAITTDGTAKLLPYKQAMIVVTPQVAGTLTGVSFNVRHPTTAVVAYVAPALEIKASGPNFTSNGLVITGSTTGVTLKYYLERVEVINMGAQTAIRFFSCFSLQEVVLPASTAVTSALTMFQGCVSLRYFAWQGTSNITDTTNMFADCQALEAVDMPNMQAVTNATSMYSNCDALVYAPMHNFAAVTNMTTMFSGCAALISVPLYNTPLASSLNSMFLNCVSLQYVPEVRGANGRTYTSYCSGCSGLVSVDTGMFNNASNLTDAFRNCVGLVEATVHNTGTVTNLTSMFQGCISLERATIFASSSAVTLSSLFSLCSSLEDVQIYGLTAPTTVTAIFSSCARLQNVPDLPTQASTSFSFAFSGCVFLKSAPNWDTSSATTVNSMFLNCYSLEYIPAYNFSLVTDFTSAFQNCLALAELPDVQFPTGPVTAPNMIVGCNKLRRTPTLNIPASFVITGCYSLDEFNFYNLNTSISFNDTRLSAPDIVDICSNKLTGSTTGQTLTITYCMGNIETGGARAKTVTTTSRGLVLTTTNTSSIVPGMFWLTGAANPATAATTFAADIATDVFTFAGTHNVANGTLAALASTGTITGLVLRTTYYVVNATASTLQLSLTLGGPPVAFAGTNSNVTIRFLSYVVSVNPNVSITMSAPATAAGTNVTVSFLPIDVGIAYLRNYSVSA